MNLSQRLKDGTATENNAETFNVWLNKNKDEISENNNEDDEDENSDFER
jgi:post-segregation antitoxin (ccd killing protein)